MLVKTESIRWFESLVNANLPVPSVGGNNIIHEVSRAKAKDVERILFVINRSNSEAYRRIIPPEHFREPVLTLGRLLEDFEQMIFYIGQVKRIVIAVAALKIVNNEVGQIRWVYVLPERQRTGVGTSLIRHIENEGKRAGLKELMIPYVHETAYWARDFYRKLGYTAVGRRPRPWGADIVYRKTLT